MVAGVGAVFLIDDDGRFARGRRLAGRDRPFDIRLSSEGIFVSFGGAVRLFKDDGTVYTIFKVVAFLSLFVWTLWATIYLSHHTDFLMLSV